MGFQVDALLNLSLIGRLIFLKTQLNRIRQTFSKNDGFKYFLFSN